MQDVQLSSNDEELDLWLKQPESEELNPNIVGGHLCSCDNVCVAVLDDTLASS